MACGACGKRNTDRSNSDPTKYDLAGGVDIRSLNNRQITARLEVFKRKFCSDCQARYTCDYSNYLNCLGVYKK